MSSDVIKNSDVFTFNECQYHMFIGSSSLGRFRIFPKGRRLGATRGASMAYVGKANDGYSVLWGDTINSNIDRYVERYFKPYLNHCKIKYKYSAQKKLLEIGVKGGYIDFRSADKPENWEGFGYNYVFLNEAGIILNNPYLYYNAVLPMLMDHPDSELVAAGTPKLLKGKGRLFYELYQKALDGETDFYTKTFTTYDNPFLTRDQIRDLEIKIPAVERDQEIHGKFVLKGGSIVDMSWFKRYKVRPSVFIKIIQSWDTASKEREINDPSVCTTWGVANGVYYLLDVYSERLKYPNLKRNVKNLALKWKPNEILIEDKASGIALIQDLRADIEFYSNITAVTPVADKVTRMSTASLTIEAGNVYLPESASWLTEFELEMGAFPDVPHDDQVDSTSQFLNHVTSSNEIYIG